MTTSNHSALARYESLLTVDHGTVDSWTALAGALRAEAAALPAFSDWRRKRIDRAEDCEARALRIALRTADRVFAEVEAMQVGGAL